MSEKIEIAHVKMADRHNKLDRQILPTMQRAKRSFLNRGNSDPKLGRCDPAYHNTLCVEGTVQTLSWYQNVF